jgi:tripartite ATP-independent transporter DctM subunit
VIIAVFIATMLIGIGIGLPIAMALLLCAVCTALAMGGGDANPTIIARTLMQGSDSVTMMALPFFVLAGEIMNRGGLTKRIIAFCDVFLGRIRGGLGYVTIFACLMFAALVGSAVAACAALGAILIPMMVRSGYNREESSALVASANLVAPIMPPSVPMIVYGVSAGVSIKSMFMAGIAPAVYLTIIACVVWFLRTRKEGVVPSVEDFKAPTPKEAVRIFLGGLWALLLPVIILVGLHSGKFTATEAGVIACVYAILVGLLVYREMKLKDLGPVFVSAAKTSALADAEMAGILQRYFADFSFMFLAAAANVAAYYMTVSRIPQLLTAGLEGLVDSPTLLMIVLMLIVVVVGLAMDVTPSILILTPIMLPLVKAAGISPVYFGVCFVLMNVLGLTSPPVGPVLNVACAAGNVKMDKIIPPTMPYFLTQTALCFLLAIFPPLVEVPLKWFGG